MNISVVIASHGEESWADLAESRACCSALNERPHEVIVLHGEGGASLAQTRNEGASRATGDWLLFLDADDELSPGFIEAMLRKIVADGGRAHGAPLLRRGHWRLYTPAVEYVPRGSRSKRNGRIWPRVDLRTGNWLVIGTVMPRPLFEHVGGFHEWPLYEDWCLWQRCELAGAAIVQVPEALYVAHAHAHSRNRAAPRRERLEIHNAIVEANYGGKP